MCLRGKSFRIGSGGGDAAPEENLHLIPKTRGHVCVWVFIFLKTTSAKIASPGALLSPPTPTKRKTTEKDALTISCMTELFVWAKWWQRGAAEGTTSAGWGMERCGTLLHGGKKFIETDKTLNSKPKVGCAHPLLFISLQATLQLK